MKARFDLDEVQKSIAQTYGRWRPPAIGHRTPQPTTMQYRAPFVQELFGVDLLKTPLPAGEAFTIGLRG